MLDWLGAIESEALAQKVADTLVHTRPLNHPGEARVPAGSRYGIEDARLVKAVRVMEEHVEDKLTLKDIARMVEISDRQLERLFHRHLHMTPVGFYRQLRLDRAHRLLAYSRLSVRDVALATGFSTLAEFSRAFKNRHGRPPSHARRLVP
jgi:AraC family transcriptional regulator, carnitine catabolism transcriptional activator